MAGRLLWSGTTSWLDVPHELRLVKDDQLPPDELVTTVFAFAFQGEQLLMCRFAERGWDLPGGRRQPGESPEATARREVAAEAGTELGELHLFGHMHVNIPEPPAGYGYPFPDSYGVFYTATVSELRPFVAGDETLERQLFPPRQARRLPWIRRNRLLYEAVLIANVSNWSR